MGNLITSIQTNSNQEIQIGPDQIEKNVSLINSDLDFEDPDQSNKLKYIISFIFYFILLTFRGCLIQEKKSFELNFLYITFIRSYNVETI